MSLKLSHKILLLISIPLAFILVVIGLFAINQNAAKSAAVTGVHSDAVLEQTHTLMQTIADADDSEREFLITRNPAFAERYRSTAAAVRPLIAGLAQFESDEPDHVAALAALAQTANRQMERSAAAVNAAETAPLSDAAINDFLVSGALLRDDTRRAMTASSDIEDQQQDNRDTMLVNSVDLSYKLMIVAGITAFGLTLTIMTIFSRGVIRRIQNLGARALRFANGEPVGPIEARPADDEIGIADQAIYNMAALVAERQEVLIRYRLLSETARDIILFTRRSDLRILEANDAAVKAYGYTRAELLQLTCADLRAPEAIADLPEHLSLVEKGPIVYETRQRRKDGTAFSVEVSGQSADIAGESYVLSISRDLTDRVRAENARKKFFDASADMMCTANFDGYLTEFNPAWEQTLGYSSTELRATPYLELVHADDREATAAVIKDLANGKSLPSFEARLRRKDGSYVWFLWSAMPALDENLIYAIGHNIAERKLDDEDLTRSRDQAMESSRVKSQFLANMSHEIRTPMNGIVGTTELLACTRLDADQREYTEIIKVSANALLTIVNQILDLSKLEAGKVVVEAVEFSPVSVVESVAVLFAAQARAKDIAIQSNVSAAVPRLLRGDVGHLRQVLLNIAGNAVKFTERGRIDIRATVQSAEANSVVLRFTISDSGIGLTQEDRKKLFEPFVQADMTTTRKFGGTGLGLSISKHMVELMNGEIGVVSNIGSGSAFWFTARFDRATDEVGDRVHSSLTGLRPLVVDADSTSRGILNQYMATWGMRSGDGASTKAEALEALRNAAAAGDPFQIVIVEAGVAFDGDIVRAVAGDPALSNTKIILLSPIGARQNHDGMATNGFASYLSKPIRQSSLFDSITAALSHDSLLDERPADVGAEGIANAVDLVHHANQRILLAEDNHINQRLAVAQFRKLGIEADVAANGREAVDATARCDYALVLMDCQMPEMDGFAATRAIRKAELSTGLHIPIIAMTANAMDGDREACVSQGMDDYLAKPVDLDQLRAMLNRWIPDANQLKRESKAHA